MARLVKYMLAQGEYIRVDRGEKSPLFFYT